MVELERLAGGGRRVHGRQARLAQLIAITERDRDPPRHRLLVLVSVGLALGAGVLLILTRGPQAPPPLRGPASADTFIDSIGVQTHLNYVDTAYVREQQVLERIRELGVHHVREGAPVNAPALGRGLRDLARQGVGATLGTDLKFAPEVSVNGGLQAMGRRVDAFEAPNELDNSGVAGWRGQLADYLPSLRAAMRRHGSRVPLVGPSFVDPYNYRFVARTSYGLSNFHPYAGGEPPETALDNAMRQARTIAQGRPPLFTETGYHNALYAKVGQPPVSETAAAVYLPRTLLRAFALGARRTFIYELLDEKPDPGLLDAEQHFGLLHQDLSPKPAFAAVRNLIHAVRSSPGKGTERTALPSVRSKTRVDQIVLTRADRSRVLALWRPVSVWDRDARRATDPGRIPVTVNWPAPVRDLTVTRPSLGPRSVSAIPSASSIRLQMEGDVMLLSYR